MAWKGLFQHLEGSHVDDYHESKHAHDIQIEEWRLYWYSNYVFITMKIVAQVVHWQLLTLLWQMGVEVPLVMEPLKVVELLGVVVQGHPLVHGVHCPYLTQL
jgi:hypothetical protein